MKDAEDIRVADAMTRGVICVGADATIEKVADVMKKNDISSVIVTKKGQGVGIVTERDIICKIVAKNKSPKKTTASEAMTSPLITIKPDTTIDDAARIMRDKDIRRLIVSDKDLIIGVLSEFDIVKIEPTLHLLIREQYDWKISEAHAASEGYVCGICDSCDKYSENLTEYDGQLLCDQCGK